MREFARLFLELDASTSTRSKVTALTRYLGSANDHDAAWAVYFLAGGKPRRAVPSKVLREFAVTASGLPEWLFEESYHAVGDLAETIALLLPAPVRRSEKSLAEWVVERVLPLRGQPAEAIKSALASYFDELSTGERFLLVKLIGGAFRVGVSRLLVTRALAEHAGIDARQISQRMIGYTDDEQPPTADGYRALIGTATLASVADPYPFYLASSVVLPLDQFEPELGSPSNWLVEWKYDGIRAQLVRRSGQAWLWSRGEELIGERFPEVIAGMQRVPDGTVLDGEVLVWRDNAPLPFALLQKRITRKSVTPKILKEAPAAFVVYDLLESGGEDWRNRPQGERRAALEWLANGVELLVSPRLEAADWPSFASLRAESRRRGVEGLMLKRLDARYRVGRTRDPGGANWWKWKIDPLSIDAVLIYAQPGSGRRASLYTDYTFAVWSEEGAARELVPFAKAYSGLTDAEIRQVDAIVRRTTVEKFGPVRRLEPTQVFEIGFEGIQPSPRHKSGIAVRFPRMLRWRQDKPVEQADTLDSLRALMAAAG